MDNGQSNSGAQMPGAELAFGMIATFQDALHDGDGARMAALLDGALAMYPQVFDRIPDVSIDAVRGQIAKIRETKEPAAALAALLHLGAGVMGAMVGGARDPAATRKIFEPLKPGLGHELVGVVESILNAIDRMVEHGAQYRKTPLPKKRARRATAPKPAATHLSVVK